MVPEFALVGKGDFGSTARFFTGFSEHAFGGPYPNHVAFLVAAGPRASRPHDMLFASPRPQRTIKYTASGSACFV